MRTLLNIIWFLFGGLPLFLGYLLAGVIACIFVIDSYPLVSCHNTVNVNIVVVVAIFDQGIYCHLAVAV